MGVLGVVERTAHSYPAVLPFLIIGLLASTLWAYRRRRYWLMGAIAILTVGATLIYTSDSSAEASARLLPAGGSALLATPAGGGGPPRDGPPQFANFSSTMRLHPRFPADFPLPSSFIHEHSSGGLRQGSVTVRFRFRGEGADAVHDLREEGIRSGWTVDVLAPHRMVFHKDNRMIEAWFSYPGHSLVLDIPEPR